MKAITLHTDCTENSGKRREAGETVAVGTAPDRIQQARARDLVDRRLAVAVTAKA